MAGTKLKDFTASAAWTDTCSVVGSDSASPTGSFFWTKGQFDAVYARLGAANTLSAVNTFSNKIVARQDNGTVGSIVGASGGFISFDGTYVVLGSNPGSDYAAGIGFDGMHMRQDFVLTFTNNNFYNGTPDTALARLAANVLKVTTGAAGGTGGGLNFPETASDADMAAPASGATLYSKIVGGKNALFVRFPTGSPVQIAIEP